MSLQSCCESNCNKGNTKSTTSKNNVLLLCSSFCPEGFLVTLANHWQHLGPWPSRQRSAPALNSACTCGAQAAQRRWRNHHHESHIFSANLRSEICFNFTSAKCFPSRLTHLSMASGKNISTPWHFCWNLRSSCGTTDKMLPASAPFLYASGC